jgi:hypothetical protein
MKDWKTANQFSEWLYNRFVEMECGALADSSSRSMAYLWEDALRLHLANVQGKGMGLARRAVSGYLREIARYRKSGRSYRLEYSGAEGMALAERDGRLRSEALGRMIDPEAISILSRQTEPKALRRIGKLLRSADQFRSLQMAREDDAYTCGAFNMLARVLANNGYEMSPEGNRRTVRKIEGYRGKWSNQK